MNACAGMQVHVHVHRTVQCTVVVYLTKAGSLHCPPRFKRPQQFDFSVYFSNPGIENWDEFDAAQLRKFIHKLYENGEIDKETFEKKINKKAKAKMLEYLDGPDGWPIEKWDEMMKDEPAGYGQSSQEPANKKSRKH